MPNFNFLSKPIAWLILLLLAVPVTTVWLSRAVPNNGHLGASDCRSCHLAGQVTADNANMLVSSEEDLCLRCHPNALKASHPSGFRPDRPVPRGMPLDWKGDLSCSTCHQIHAPMGTGILRMGKRGQAFCLLCHDQKFFQRMMDGGSSMMSSGHLDTRKATMAMGFDSLTTQCIGCHTEMAGGNKIQITATGVMRHNGSSMSHPMGSRYQDFTRGQGYRSLELLPPEIFLPDGRLGCVSCHEGYSEVHGKLVISNRGSGLCLACHDL